MIDKPANVRVEILGDILVIALSVVLFVVGVVSQIQKTEYIGQEFNLIILIAEIIMSISILLLGINRLLTENTREFLEISGDVILIFGGFILAGMFLTILINSQFHMYRVELVFLITRLIISLLTFGIGLNRLLDDCK